MMKKSTKKAISCLMAFMLVILSVIVAPIETEAANWSSDYKYWSQGASDEKLMRDYGCWVVAQSRMIYELGINRSQSFNPDVYKEWERANGFLDSGFYQINGATAPVEYAKQCGATLNYLGFVNINNNVWNYIQKGYSMIACVANYGHYVLIDNETSRSTGVHYCYDSWPSQTSVGSKPLSNYSGWVGMYAYSFNGISSPPTPHTCDFGTFKYFWKSHPHYNCYSCSVCGEIHEDRNSSNYYSLCDECNSVIEPGNYYLKNRALGKYLCVSATNDVNGQNVIVDNLYTNSSDANREKMSISATTVGYKIRPLMCSSRLINPLAWTVSSGINVTIYDDDGESSQHWTFEKVADGYILHNVQEPSCVLDVQGNGNVVVATQHGGPSQIWTLEPANQHTHTYSAWGTVTVATCTTAGTEKRTCECGATEQRSVNALGHNYSNEWTVDVAPTVTSVGYKSHHCTRCDEKKDVVEISKLNCTHVYSEWTTKYPATCTETGTDQHVCIHCGFVDYRGVPMKEHTYGEWVELEYDKWNNGEYVISSGPNVIMWGTDGESITQVRICTMCKTAQARLGGSCGDNAMWTYDDSTGTVTISGFGPMTDYLDYQGGPWCQFNRNSDFQNINSVVIEDGITSIGNYAFYGCKNLTNVTLPDSVMNIGKSSFEFCSSLTRVKLPDSITKISDKAFNFCTGLEEIDLSNSLSAIEHEAFAFCKSLKSIEIPKSVSTIGRSTFEGCTALKEITIPEGVEVLAPHTFDGCISLDTLNIPATLKELDVSALKGCSSLTKLRIHDENPYFCILDDVIYNKDYTKLIKYPTNKKGLTYKVREETMIIGEGAFNGCTDLVSIQLPKGLTTIEGGAFSGCNSLEAINIPDSITGIGAGSFVNCKAIKSIIIPKGVTEINNYTFWECDSLVNITLPEGLKSIGREAFGNCFALETIVLPNSIADIGHQAFWSCKSLKYVELPESLKYLKTNTFLNCTELKTVIFGGNVKTIESEAFNCCFALERVVIPRSALEIAGGEFGAFVDSKDIYIYGYQGSYAEIYATENNIPFVALNDSCDDLHQYSELATIEADCIVTGKVTLICSVCGKIETQVTNPLGHNYSTEWTVDVAPSITTAGSKSHHCTRCDAKTDITEIPSTGAKDITEIFTDIKPGAWYVDAVQYAISNSLFSGMSETTFEPNTAMTRAMLVKVLHNLEGNPTSSEYGNPFTDVKADNWYTDAVKWAQANGVVYGKTDTTFAPNEKITREQLVTMLYRYASYKKYDVTDTAELTSFPDGDRVSSYAQDALKWAVGAELISGNKINGVDMLDARGNATRAQVAKILRGFCENVVK